MSFKRHVILNFVDTPLKLLFWTIPEVMMFIVPVLIGLFVSQLMLGCVIMFVCLWLYKLYCRNFGKGELQSVIYWYLPANQRLKRMPASFIREYLS
jgi:type IV conjugative transfer system protein TraL